MLRELTLTYISCVENPVQRLLLAIAAHLDLRIYGVDASDTFKHIIGPYVTTFVSINDQFDYWYRQKIGNIIDRDRVLPLLRDLQSHPESGRLWESLINQILNKTGFNNTTNDRTIYISIYKPIG